MAHGRSKPALITDAERGRDEQLRTRQIRYGVMMGIRALLLIIATVLVMVKVPILWLWLSLCAVGMVVLPWTAVMVANDRLPKEEHRISRWRPWRRAKPDTSTKAVASKKSSVIDVDS
ncbi:MAG TPA: DUF3099 domain-containing protein [Stackebrandtia sp.]|jgi:hypothetical protein|uniref:DUF3099 domain-containing protein n=1 Tax=Stackebrandtia sp. TaxID=2023065 RepID=UPI002D76277B|nr:DUF3099 domain-containing protein [Stackebrandtia sp.]HZE41838.1 DUF3099 domain-containing protein [Stackebrandtia sp.]